MQIFHHVDALPAEARGAVVAIGNFDGVHRGHQAVIRTTRRIAAEAGRPAAVMAFEPHPRSVFQPSDPPFRLTPFRVRARLLQEAGVDLHYVLRFDTGFSRTSAEAFVDDILVGSMAVRHVVVGADFCYGHKRGGSSATLREAGQVHGFGVSVLTKVGDEHGGAYASTSVRDQLIAGDMRRAARLLGRPWEIEGRVVHGDKRGRTLGYPTANLPLGDYLRPAFGVYAVQCAIDEGAVDTIPDPVWRDGVANIGVRPMYEAAEPLLEAHIFDFDEDLYGRHLRVRLTARLRGEVAFDGPEALVAQMDRDSRAAREALARTGSSVSPEKPGAPRRVRGHGGRSAP